jgi:hypothetical protein
MPLPVIRAYCHIVEIAPSQRADGRRGVENHRHSLAAKGLYGIVFGAPVAANADVRGGGLLHPGVEPMTSLAFRGVNCRVTAIRKRKNE